MKIFKKRGYRSLPFSSGPSSWTRTSPGLPMLGPFHITISARMAWPAKTSEKAYELRERASEREKYRISASTTAWPRGNWRSPIRSMNSGPRLIQGTVFLIVNLGCNYGSLDNTRRP